MNVFFRIVITTLMLIISQSAFSSSQTVAAISMQKVQDEPVYPDDEPVGDRKPGRLIPCIIDFANKTVSLSVADEIISYEIWSEGADVCVFSSIEAVNFVKCLSNLNGLYQLKFLTEKYSYIGYISL